MENYKVIIVKLARPDTANGAKMFARLLGIPEEKSNDLIAMMPLVLFEAKNFAIARKFKALLAPMETYGFPVLVTMESATISKVNWPKNIRLNGMLIEEIAKSVPDFVNLMNHCPSCGTEIRYQVSLRIENEQTKFPLNSAMKKEEVSTQILQPEDEIVEMEEVEEITELDEINDSLYADSDGELVAQAIEAEDVDVHTAVDLFSAEGLVSLAGSKRNDSSTNAFEAVSNMELENGYTEAAAIDLFGGEYSLAVGVINSLNDRIKAARILSEILGIAESEALLKIKKTGDVIIQNVTLDEAKSFKQLFEQKKLNVKIIN